MDGIEEMVLNSEGEAAILVAHSMGCRIAHYFTHWVVHSERGIARGGKHWIDKNIHSFVPIAGPFLGTLFYLYLCFYLHLCIYLYISIYISISISISNT